MNSISVQYSSSEYRIFAPKEKVIAFLKKVCEHEGLDKVQFSVSFIDEENMRFLNKTYRGIDNSTDILSFAVQDGNDDFDFPTGRSRYRNLGDMLICPEVCMRNASDFGVESKEELHRLLIHGILHLKGMDHVSNDADEPMLMHQEDILKKLYLIQQGGLL